MNESLRHIILLSTIIFVLLFSLLASFKKNRHLKSIIKENNQVLGATYETRQPDEIILDMRTNEPIIYSFEKWSHKNADTTDLYGWDDRSIPEYLQTVGNQLLPIVKEMSKMAGTNSYFFYRTKMLDSLVNKLILKNLDKRYYPSSHATDLVGVRFIMKELLDITPFSENLQKMFNTTEYLDYITSPKSSGYRSIHLIINHKNLSIEVQIRTPGMDFWGEWSHDLFYKHRDHIIDLLGIETFDRLETYSAELSDYLYQMESGIDTPEPTAPEELKQTLNILSPYVKKMLQQDGTPNFEKILKEKQPTLNPPKPLI